MRALALVGFLFFLIGKGLVARRTVRNRRAALGDVGRVIRLALELQRTMRALAPVGFLFVLIVKRLVARRTVRDRRAAVGDVFDVVGLALELQRTIRALTLVLLFFFFTGENLLTPWADTAHVL